MLYSSRTVIIFVVFVYAYGFNVFNKIELFSFVKTSTELNNQLLPCEDHIKKGELTPAMDIFSAG